jgi:hypothetical protein
MADVPPDLAFLQWLIDEAGFLHPKPIPGNRWAALQPKLFTCAVATGRMGDRVGFDERWCYAAMRDARAALDAWDGQGEPSGWIRHPTTGRRVSRTGDEIGEDGNRVGAIGVVYVRF